MPFTPFHFGLGATLHAAAPRRVSFLAFCGANVLTDIEPLYFMLAHQWPLHRTAHTFWAPRSLPPRPSAYSVRFAGCRFARHCPIHSSGNSWA